MLPHDKRGLLDVRKRVVNIGGVDAVESDQQFCSRCCNSLLKQYNGRAELGEVFEAAAEAGVWEDTKELGRRRQPAVNVVLVRLDQLGDL